MGDLNRSIQEYEAMIGESNEADANETARQDAVVAWTVGGSTSAGIASCAVFAGLNRSGGDQESRSWKTKVLLFLFMGFMLMTFIGIAPGVHKNLATVSLFFG